MKILFLSDDFPPKSYGGAGIITSILAQGLARAGNEVYVITTIQKKATEGWRNFGDIRVFDMYSDYPSRLSTYISLYNPSVCAKVQKLIEEMKPDVIHVHNIHNYLSYYCLKLARSYTPKTFLTTHDAMSFNYGKFSDFYDTRDLSVHTEFSYRITLWQHIKTARKRFNPFRNMIIRYMLNTYPKKIFAISNRLENALNQNGIRNVTTIHYGIDCSEWSVQKDEADAYVRKLDIEGKKIIFFGGRLSRAKGADCIVYAMKLLVQKDPACMLLIAGTDNGYAQHLLAYAESIGIRKHIIFTGWLDRGEMKKVYAIADVVATPSIYFDAFNLFNIEAGAAGKPVVGTCFGGTPEIIRDKVTGLIVNPNNHQMLADALYTIISNPSYAQQLGRAGQRRVQEYFNLKRYVEKTLEWYQE